MIWGEDKVRAEAKRRNALQYKEVPKFRRVDWLMHFGASLGFPESKRNEYDYRKRGDHHEVFFHTFMMALECMNWWVAQDRDVHRIIRFQYFMGAHRTSRLRFRAEYHPNGIKIEFYPDRNTDHPSGPRYGGSERAKAMGHRDWLVYRATMRTLERVARSFGCDDMTTPVFDDPKDELAWRYYSDTDGIGWHTKEVTSIENPYRPTNAYQGLDRDGKRVVNGDFRFFRDHRGRLWCGRAYGGINQDWHVVAGGELKRTSHSNLFADGHAEPRKLPNEFHVARVKTLIEKAVAKEDFEKASVLRDYRKKLEEAGAAKRRAW